MERMTLAQIGALRALVVALERGSLTDAGRRLDLSPSAVSKQLSRLEDALGTRLLERTTRSIRPTAAGLELVRRTRPLLEGLDDAATTIRDRRSEVSGRVRISATRAFGRVCLTPLLARLSAAHPQLELDVVLTASRLDFIEDDVDLAIREGPLDDSSLTARKLRDVAVVACASPAYLARRGRPRAIDDLVRHELLVVPASGPASDVTRLRGRSGRRLALVPRIRVNDLLVLAALAEAGAGVALLPDYVADDALARGSLVRVLPRIGLPRLAMHAVYPSRRHLPRRVGVVLDALATSAHSSSAAPASTRNARDVLPSRPFRHSRP